MINWRLLPDQHGKGIKFLSLSLSPLSLVLINCGPPESMDHEWAGASSRTRGYIRNADDDAISLIVV